METPLISIIIPTFNRAQLIGETLDSVMAQTYPNWECIVVDDGSTDKTEVVMAEYMLKDARIIYFQRPSERPKGANACRNYGLQKANGIYINWFDSDDLMKPDFLKRKIEVIEREEVDFVVSKSLDFDEKGTYEIEKYKGNFKHELSGRNYVFENVYWITQDFFIKAEKLGGYEFNEILQSGQETNFFMVFLNKRHLKGVAIDEHLSYRRIHSTSIQQTLKRSKKEDGYRGKLLSWLTAYNAIYGDIDVETKFFMQAEIMVYFYILKDKSRVLKHIIKFTANLTLNKNPIKALAFLISVITNSYFGGGYKLLKFARS